MDEPIHSHNCSATQNLHGLSHLIQPYLFPSEMKEKATTEGIGSIGLGVTLKEWQHNTILCPSKAWSPLFMGFITRESTAERAQTS